MKTKGVFMRNVLLFVLMLSVFVTAGVTYYVKSTGTGTLAQGQTWAQAWNYDTVALAKKDGTVNAGDTVYVLGGATYSLTAAVGDTVKNPGTATGMIAWIGVKAATTNAPPVYTDWIPQADTANMPKINYTTRRFAFSAYNYIYGMYFYGDTIRGVITGSNCNVLNCKIRNAAEASSTNYTVYFGGFSNVVGCIFTSPNSKGVYNASYNCYVGNVFDHFTDATNGIGLTTPGAGGTYINNIFISCKKYAVDAGNIQAPRFINCVFDSCDININASTSYSCLFINNLNRYVVTTGYKWTTQTPANLFLRNNIGLNNKNVTWSGVDTLTAFQDHWQTSGDPLVTTPGKKYTLESGSPAIDSGYNVKFGLQ